MVSKGRRPEDDGIYFDKDNEVRILMPSFIDFFLKKKKRKKEKMLHVCSVNV